MPGISEIINQRRELGLLLAAALLAWAPSMRNGFVWLDRVEIQEAGYLVRNGDDFKRVWSWSLGSFMERDYISERGPRGSYYRPVYALVNTVSNFLWRGRAWLWHLEAVLWHALVVILLYLLGLRVAPPTRQDAWRQAVFWASLLFAVHPLGAQSVAWISGRKDTLCTAFALIAIHGFLNSGESRERSRRIAWRAVSGAAFFVALGCKELALLVPAILTAGAVTRTFARPRDRAQAVFLVSLWLAAIAFAVYRAAMLGGFGLGAPPPETSLTARVAMSASVFWEYISRILIPRPGLLSDAWPLTRGASADLLFVGSFVVALSGMTACFFKFPRARFGLLWFGIWLLPASGITPLWHFRAERYLYPASWGLLILAVLALQEILQRLPRESQSVAGSRCAWILSTGAAVALMMTWSSLSRWSSDAALFGDAVRRDPNHAEAHAVLGEHSLRQEDFPRAERHLRAALAAVDRGTHSAYLTPFVTRTNLGLVLYKQRRHDEALVEFQRAEAVRRGNAAAHYHVGLAALGLGDLDLAEKKFREALGYRPSDTWARANLAVTLMQRGDLEGCLAMYRPLIDKGWSDPQGLRNYASVLLALRRHAEARPFFERIIAAEPGDTLSLAKLAWCQDVLGEKEAAKRNLDTAIARDPENPAIRDIARQIGKK